MPSPTNKLFAIPTPPDTINAPVEVEVEAVVSVTVVTPENAACLNVENPVVLIPVTERFVNPVPSPYNWYAVTIPAFNITLLSDLAIESGLVVPKPTLFEVLIPPCIWVAPVTVKFPLIVWFEELGLMVLEILLLTCIFGFLFVSYLLFLALRRINVYENFIVQFQQIVEYAEQQMKNVFPEWKNVKIDYE